MGDMVCCQLGTASVCGAGIGFQWEPGEGGGALYDQCSPGEYVNSVGIPPERWTMSCLIV